MNTPSRTIAPLRVAYVLKRYPRFSETFIVNEILALERQGVEVDIFAFKPATEGCFHENLAQVRARVTYLGTSYQKVSRYHETLALAIEQLPAASELLPALLNEDAESLEYGIRIALALREHPADVIHAHFASKSATVARLASLLTGTPLSITAHAKDIFHDSVSSADLALKFSTASAVITVSEFNRTYLQQTFPEASDRVVRLYNGMDLTRLPFATSKNGPPRALAVGRLVTKKGFADLLDAMALLREVAPDLQCDIVGDGPLRADLEAQCRALGLEKTVIFHGLQAQHRVHQMIRDARVFLAPCVISEDGDRDGLPTVLLEAMALGTPVVATGVTGIPELVEDRHSGLIVPQHNPSALANAAQQVFDNRDFAEALARAAREMIETSFNIEHTSAQLNALWRGLATGSIKQAGAQA